MPLEKAIHIIEEGSGNHFDPAVVSVFVDNAAQWYRDIYQQPSEVVEATLRAQLARTFSE